MGDTTTVEKSTWASARWYIENLGWSIVPVEKQGKTPLVKWATYQLRRATMPELAEWEAQWPDANLGVVTGAISNLIAVDIDPRHGGDVGFDSLISDDRRLPHTVESQTGGGGRHILFQHPGVPIHNKAGDKSIAPGVDIRGDGGYIVIPPSIHPSGKAYDWELSSRPNKVRIAPLPDWLLRKLTESTRPQPTTDPQGTNWARVVMHGAEEGSRNDTATRLAGRLFRRGLAASEVGAWMTLWNRSLRDSLPDDELLRTLESVARREDARRKGAPR